MPGINLRLTDEEHAALKAWAEDSKRSIQKEAVYRIFAPVEREVMEKVASPHVVGKVDVEEADEGWPVPAEIVDHFKPDFGTKLGGKKKS